MKAMSKIRALLPLTVLLMLLVISGCSSPDEPGGEVTSTPTTAEQAAGTSTLPASSPTATTEPAPSASPTQQPAATATSTSIPAPTATTEPVPTPTQPAAPTNAPTATSPASAADVWNLRQFDIDEPIMVLTFDAGAGRGYTEDILDVLAAEGILASFGMTGPWAEDNPDLLARIVNEGHQLMNHSWSHPHFPELTSEERIEEIQRLEDYVRSEVGVEMQPYFRPPFGEYDEPTLTDLARLGYTVNVMWTVDTLGWNGLTADEINARVMDAAAPGAIVLMHVGIQSQDAAALPEMIRLLREQGYSFARIDELATR